jgi:hypothetical protein
VLSCEEEANFEDSRNASDNACESGADEERDEAGDHEPQDDGRCGEVVDGSGEDEDAP